MHGINFLSQATQPTNSWISDLGNKLIFWSITGVVTTVFAWQTSKVREALRDREKAAATKRLAKYILADAGSALLIIGPALAHSGRDPLWMFALCWFLVLFAAMSRAFTIYRDYVVDIRLRRQKLMGEFLAESQRVREAIQRNQENSSISLEGLPSINFNKEVMKLIELSNSWAATLHNGMIMGQELSQPHVPSRLRVYEIISTLFWFWMGVFLLIIRHV